MAKTQTAFLERARVPARAALQEAIKDLKFRLTLDDAYIPFESSGYLPCTLDGEDAGFDIRFADGTGEVSAVQLDGRDVSIVFRWGGDPREYASAMIVSAALADRFGALVHRPEGLLEADKLIKEARKAFEAAQE